MNNKGKSIGVRQREFALELARLVVWINQQGFEVSFGDAYRDPRVHGDWGEKRGYGSAVSYHKRRLAVDLNIFLNGRYLRSTAAHRFAGEEWERRGGTWGGRWDDGNHYSWGERSNG